MRERMERLVLLPFAMGCISESSVAVGVLRHPRRRSKLDRNPSQRRTKEVEEEEEEEDSVSGESMKNLFRSLDLPKPNISTGIHRLFKGFKNFSQLFVYKDDMEEVLEMDMEIGSPTDVKHVTHIGWDTSASAASSTTDPFKDSPDNLVSPDQLSVSPASWRQFQLSMPPQGDALPLGNGSS